MNPIIIQDCGDEVWPDTWSLELDGQAIAYVHGEMWADILAAIFKPSADPFDLLDVLILLMRAGTQLAEDFEKLRTETGNTDG